MQNDNKFEDHSIIQDVDNWQNTHLLFLKMDLYLHFYCLLNQSMNITLFNQQHFEGAINNRGNQSLLPCLNMLRAPDKDRE